MVLVQKVKDILVIEAEDAVAQGVDRGAMMLQATVTILSESLAFSGNQIR
jgi:hypothetical protein